MKAGAWHLLGIIEEILTFSRVEAGSEPVASGGGRSPRLVADGAVSLVEPQATRRGSPCG